MRHRFPISSQEVLPNGCVCVCVCVPVRGALDQDSKRGGSARPGSNSFRPEPGHLLGQNFVAKMGLVWHVESVLFLGSVLISFGKHLGKLQERF